MTTVRAFLRRAALGAALPALALSAGARAALGAVETPPVRLHASNVLEPPAVLARYVAALGAIKRPKSESFEFAVEQSGLRNLEQTHRVYRAGLNERDETISADGYTLTSPSVRIFRSRINRYEVALVSPKPGDYDFTFAGLARSGDRTAYVFRTKRRSPASYAATEVVIDGLAFLPLSVSFTLAANGVRGEGSLLFAPASEFWLIRTASVNATISGKPARERITFTRYAFPALPPSTFDQRRTLAAPAEASELDAP